MNENRPNPLQASNGTARLGTWVKIASLVTFELLLEADYDFVIVDLEHSPIALDWLHTACAVAQPQHCDVLVRMPDCSGRDVQRVLDLGVNGVVFPQVRNVAAATAAVQSALFPPRGHRGAATTSRAGRWGQEELAAYLRRGDEEVVRCIQVEAPENVADLEALFDVPGVSAALLGLLDLSVALGRPVGDPTLTAFTTEFVRQARMRSLPCGTAVGTVNGAREALAAGFDFIVLSNDASVFAHALAALAGDVHTQLRPQHPSPPPRTEAPGEA